MEAAGLIVGEMQMINPKGEVTTYLIDGTVIKDQDPIEINWCDKCERYKPLDFGRYDGSQGLSMIWVCVDCK